MSTRTALKIAIAIAVVGVHMPLPVLAAQQSQETRCYVEPNGEYRCITYGSAPPPPPPPPPTDIPGVTVIGQRPPSWWDYYQRSLYDSLFQRQSGPAPVFDGGSGNSTQGAVPKNGDPSPNTGCEGNPIIYATGNKIEPEVDFALAGEVPLYLKRTYNHYWNRVGLFGKFWISNFDLKIEKSVDGQTITAYRNDGSQVSFVYGTSPSAAWWEDKSQPTARIVSDGSGGYIYYAADNSVERYDSVGQVTSQKNSRGIGLTFNYTSGRLANVTHTSGRQVILYWTGDKLTSVTDPAGNAYNYTYTANAFGTGLHRLAATFYPNWPMTTIDYHYAATGDTSRFLGKSLNGVRFSTFTYDSSGRAISSEHAGGVEKYTFSYTPGADGLLTVLRTNPLGKQTTSVFQNGKFKSDTGHFSANCSASFRDVTYDANGFIDTTADLNSNITDYDYNAKGQVVRKVEAAGTPVARETTFVWDANGRMIQERVTGLVQTDYVFRSDGLIQSIAKKNINSNGVANQTLTTAYAYTMHPSGMLATVNIDGPLAGTGDATSLSYDALGNLLTVTNSLGHTTTYSQYTALGLAGQIVSPNGATKTITYNSRGQVLTSQETVNATAQTTSYTYDVRERLTQQTDPDGESVYFGYDTANRLTSRYKTYPTEDGDPNTYNESVTETEAYTYNLLSLPTNIKVTYRYMGKEFDEDLGKPINIGYTNTQTEAWIDYDELGRVRARRGNNNQNIRYTYDGNSNVLTAKDSLNKTTTMTYDALNRVVSSLDPNGGVTSFQYNTANQPIRVEDPRHLVTTYVYDGLGLLWAQNSPDTGASTFTYNSYGQRTQLQRADLSTTTYSYDAVGRNTTTSSGGQTRTLSYDACTNGKGLICTAVKTGGTGTSASLTYTPWGQVATHQDTLGANTDTTAYSYDGMHRLTGINYPSGVSAGYGYLSGHLTTITATVNGTTSTIASISGYQAFGPANYLGYGNGLWRFISYDSDRRVVGISTNAQGGPLQSLTFGFNAADRITAITNGVDSGLTQSYAYDDLARLTSAGLAGGNTATYAYDAGGNRTGSVNTSPANTTTNTIGSGSNRLTQSVTGALTRTFAANANGDITAFTNDTGVANTLTYDPFARLSGHTKAGVTTSYTVNAFDQRVAKSNSTTTSRFTYAGFNHLLADNTNSQWTSYIWNGTEVIAMVRNNQIFYLHNDQLGRPQVATNGTKAVVWKASNHAFDRTVTQDTIGGINLGFPGQYYDAESGVWHNGYRDYLPDTGRYLQSDPIGLRGGSNTYSYVYGNPVSYTDRFGLEGGGGYATGQYQMAQPRAQLPHVFQVIDILRGRANDMQQKNFIGGDKFYHCVAMCESASLGPVEASIAVTAGAARELNQQYRRGEEAEECAADLAANGAGIAAGLKGQNCPSSCSGYMPPGMTFP